MDCSERLAIDGGPPVIPEGPPAWPRPQEAIRDALAEAFATSAWGRYHGPFSERLRAALAGLTESSHVWLCSSGTIAVELALRGLKVGAGDEVILAGYDFAGNFRAIEAVGARPVLVDLVAGGWTLDARQLSEAQTPAVKAILVSHLHGSLADMQAIREYADRRGLVIVEDACQVPGAIVQGRPAGSWGDCGVFSFGGSKLLTAGRGGAIVTRHEDVWQRLKIYCERGNDAFPLSELQAAVLLPQVAELAAANLTRHQNIELLLEQTRELPGLTPLALARQPASDQGPVSRPVFYKFPWRLTGNSTACDTTLFEQVRSRFIAAIQAEGVAVDAGFRGFGRRSPKRCRAVGDLANAHAAAENTLLLHHPVLLENPETIRRVACALRKVATSAWSGHTNSSAS